MIAKYFLLHYQQLSYEYKQMVSYMQQSLQQNSTPHIKKIKKQKRNLECDKERDCFDTMIATVDVVAHEEIVGVWRLSSNLEELQQVMKLAMHVAADGHGTFHLLNI